MARVRLAVLVAAVLATACGRGATARRQDGRAAPRSPADDASTAAPDALPTAAGDGGPAGEGEPPPAPEGGLFGRVEHLDEAPAALVLAFEPGSKSPRWSGRADAEGRFHAPDLPPGTYRVIVPGDGVHGTADLYATVAPVDAGPGEAVVVHRAKGCPVRATFRHGAPDAGGPPIVGAAVELRMPDLEQVGDRGDVLRGTTDGEGSVTVNGTCVRGEIEGTITPRGGAAVTFRHGYLGGGHDTFEISLPEGDAGARR